MKTTLKEQLEQLPADQRAAKETQLLADYARHAAFGRPLGSAGCCTMYGIKPGLEEESLAADEDVVLINNVEELHNAIQHRSQPLLLIRSSAQLSHKLIAQMAEQCLFEKAIFISNE